ncbi:hypothetical protein BB737_05680 [Mycobacterium avium subsp. hominissuis]|uniref:hypothetical protein n=1 Tax=Mycobacterium avium TaxID=1764 RepID=UPI0003925920|nr:hypothetical protein [Mycobacterium avium]ETA99590.1 hypothetical protein O982_06120 [Mycobacterium avium 10-5581]BAN32005.1 hypothetical protein MAH_2931 [Mycobacterium avium subsp. hominissuis TH135]PBJ42966.1 hypothetical protein BI294_02335 [Mycobacterium avium subsp. hominissuis]PBJ66793.1 hypothetical protein BB737_05680 [Mycobacterium avium subsp. hominissuis]QWY64948.1 hypothetical protein BJP78_24880 [Mycobacterium avium subsp. hominissuis]
MQEITRVRAFPCATRIPVEDESEGPFAALTDDEFRAQIEALRQEVLRRIGGMMAALNPQDLTFEECRDLFKLLKSFTDSRGGVI